MKKIYLIHIIVLIFVIANILNLKNLSLIDWDEGAFVLQAKYLATMGAQGKPFNFQTPPLYQMIIALLFKIFGEHAWLMPLISIISSAVTIYFLFSFGKSLYNEITGLIAVILFISTEFFFFFSKSGLSDAFFLLFFVGAVYFFYQSIKANQIVYYLFCCLFTVFACYTKYTGPVLFLIFLFIGTTRRKELNKSWFIFAIIIPILLLLPYIIIFIKIVSITNITQRHGKLLGINHLKFLYYIIRFAPLIFLSGIFYRMKEKTDYFILAIIIIFFIVLGFYYPYLRLAYPLIPFLSLFSAALLYKLKKIRYYLLALIFFFNILIGHNTLIYNSKFPLLIAQRVESLKKKYNNTYLFALVPPNIVFYFDGTILQSESNIPTALRNIKNLQIREIIKKDENLLRKEKYLLLIYSSIFEDFSEKFKSIRERAIEKDSIEFIDAPIYYKDIFNSLRTKKQIYEIYAVSIEKLDTLTLTNLWKMAFEPGMTVIKD
ncbi:MAG: ArnT family glycosyltransferase [bacterium]